MVFWSSVVHWATQMIEPGRTEGCLGVIRTMLSLTLSGAQYFVMGPVHKHFSIRDYLGMV